MPNPTSVFYGIPAESICDWCGISLRAAIAYKEGKRKPPPAVVRLVELHWNRRVLGDEFSTWACRGSELIDPEGHRMTQGMLRAYAFVWQLAWDMGRSEPVIAAELKRISSIAVARVKRPVDYEDDPSEPEDLGAVHLLQARERIRSESGARTAARSKASRAPDSSSKHDEQHSTESTEDPGLLLFGALAGRR